MAIRFVFFDLGNVLLTFDHHRGLSRLADLSGLTPSVFQAAIFESGLQVQFETGTIAEADFVAQVCRQVGCRLPEAVVLEACSDIFELNASIVPVVAALNAASQPLGILSNTCVAHWNFIQRKRYALLRDFFPISVLSYESRSMKPDGKIYEDAAAAVGVDPAEIFFTDDRSENVAGALAAGFDATQFVGVPQLIRELRSRAIPLRL